MCALIHALKQGFAVTVEVVPPQGAEAGPLLDALSALDPSPFYGYSIASNPVAKEHMSALAFSALASERTGKPSILHCTTRDHNSLSLQGLLWGARALGIETVLVATGDIIAYRLRFQSTSVKDLDVFGLVELAREASLCTGVVFDPGGQNRGLRREAERLKEKAARGAQFAVTQPVYTPEEAERIAEATASVGLPIMLGILPLRNPRHARFLDQKVSGISVPQTVQRRLEQAVDPVAEGISLSRQLLGEARKSFAGACLMPPFAHCEVVDPILKT